MITVVTEAQHHNEEQSHQRQKHLTLLKSTWDVMILQVTAVSEAPGMLGFFYYQALN